MTTVAQGPGLHEIARDVYAWIGPEGRTNAGFIVWDDGVVVIDSLYGAALVQDLQEQIRSVTDRPVRTVIDTHEHWDHCFGNQYFEGAVYTGHENCRRSLVEDPEHQREFGVRSALTRQNPDLAEEFRAVRILPPVVTYSDTMTLYPGGRAVELRYLGRAHTAGDTIVTLPEERLAFGGDVFVNDRAPFAADGYPRSWVGVLKRMEQLAIATVVPGHGELATRRDLAAMREWLEASVDTIARARGRGLSAEQAQDELEVKVPSHWANQQAGKDLIAPLYRELAGG